MSSEDQPGPYVWIWLPEATAPVVAGRLDQQGECTSFTYGTSYLGRQDAIPLYEAELPLRRGQQTARGAMRAPGCITDSRPDAWGQRVVLARRQGIQGRSTDTDQLDLFAYLLESGSDRIGALDFQTSATRYTPRDHAAPLDELVDAAARLDAGQPLSSKLDLALIHGTSVGGARPKVLIDEGDGLIAKLSSATDLYPVVKAEAATMYLAGLAGIDVPETRLVHSVGRDVLLVRRFDRPGGGRRRLIISALTILALDEHEGRYATYFDLADQIRAHFTDPTDTLRQLFARIVFNICISNTDDHARNHAAFWDGTALTLTPAYDLCPQLRSGGEAAQAMAIDRDGNRYSRFQTCTAAAGVYGLTARQAKEIVHLTVDSIRTHWADAADQAELAAGERDRMWGQQILNPDIFNEI